MQPTNYSTNVSYQNSAIYKKFTYKATTFSFAHSTPNHEHGSTAPTFSDQFNKAPNGSLTTLSLNFSKARPATEQILYPPSTKLASSKITISSKSSNLFTKRKHYHQF